MNGPEVLRIVDAIHRDKKIDEEIVFEGSNRRSSQRHVSTTVKTVLSSSALLNANPVR